MSDADHAAVLRHKVVPLYSVFSDERAAIERAIEVLLEDQYSKGYEQAMIDEGYSDRRTR